MKPSWQDEVPIQSKSPSEGKKVGIGQVIQKSLEFVNVDELDPLNFPKTQIKTWYLRFFIILSQSFPKIAICSFLC